MKKLVIFASALAILATPALAKTTKHHHHAQGKVAQGPAGLNGGNAAGPGYSPWAGPANNWNNPISGSSSDPAMQHRTLKPGQQ